jgi:hypothetical protein
MGGSDPEIRRKLFGPKWQHEIENQGWPLWKILIHRFQRESLHAISKGAHFYGKV